MSEEIKMEKEEGELEYHDILLDLIKGQSKKKKDALMKILYGGECLPIKVTEEASNLSNKHDFEIKAFNLPVTYKEELRKPRRVRIGAIQNSIAVSTSESVEKQRNALWAKIEKMLIAAGEMGTNVICLQEAWNMPFAFCTREKKKWMEFAEPIDGPTTQFLAKIAKKYQMVIVNPILERDIKRQGQIWNTVVVIDANGEVLGFHRKTHIPRVGDFNESTYYMEGNTPHTVFETKYAKIGINICYGRHFPENWAGYGLKGAEIVFNPSATVGLLSEPLWGVEARNAAIANGYFTVAINRVGTETFPNEFTSGNGLPSHKDFGHFYGSSFLTAPNGLRTPSLSRIRDSLLVAEVDLNQIRQVRDKWCFPMTRRLPVYAKLFNEASQLDWEPETVSKSNPQKKKKIIPKKK
ncbi:beta-ureidopropionase [Anaeramoeba flamelloides]|uniref:Beta-ureidopropionase n=1 Tax=Anaeramoeba flamelloides TaxID=1746091 RepID=A0AAV8A6M0_9EUKA|nr:beta-ureidopropionase [Anaeramoeba flamelloides]